MELNWVPGEAMSKFEKAALGFMRLMDESRMTRQSQQDVANYLNNNFFVGFTSDSKYYQSLVVQCVFNQFLSVGDFFNEQLQ